MRSKQESTASKPKADGSGCRALADGVLAWAHGHGGACALLR